MMDFDILDSLHDLGYSGLTEDSNVKEAIEVGTKSVLFTQIIEWFSKELQALCSLDSCVNSITDPDDSSNFVLEVSSFLKELRCPYKDLTTGLLSQRFLDEKSRLTLLDYLCTELQTARILHHRREKQNGLEITLNSTHIATSLNLAQKALDIDPAGKDDPDAVFTEIMEKMERLCGSPPDLVLREPLSPAQWDSLGALYEEFLRDYTVRRELLLTRLDLTLQSFRWGEGGQSKEAKILKAYVNERDKLKKWPEVSLSDILSATESLLVVEKTSCANVLKNTKSSLNRILIPRVPDRGGRPEEQRPPVEMPSWKKRSNFEGGDRGFHQRGGGGRQRGGGGGGGGKKRRF